ncbi:MAG: hypothetical protein WBW73_21500 [Rhodoplanes sp.]
MADRLFTTSGDWALASDGIQWSLQRRKSAGWNPVSFVRSSRDILARCMREKGVGADTATQLLAGLPATFNEWTANAAPGRAEEAVSAAPARPLTAPPSKASLPASTGRRRSI